MDLDFPEKREKQLISRLGNASLDKRMRNLGMLLLVRQSFPFLFSSPTRDANEPNRN